MEDTDWMVGERRVERDRRRHPRYAVDLPGSIVHLASGDATPIHVMVRLESISRSGGRVRLLDPSADVGPPGKSKLLVIYHASQRGRVYRANVAWVNGERLGLELVARVTSLEEGVAGLRPAADSPPIERLIEELGRLKEKAAALASTHHRFLGGDAGS